MRTLIKRAAIHLHCRRLLPARVVVWLFRTFKLRSL